MWKQNSQRLMAELDKLRSELQAEMKHRMSLQMEVLEVHTKCNGLQQEFDKLKLLMEELKEKQEAKGNILFQMKDKDIIKKEWEREIKVQKDLNVNLALELKRSQEANLELVSKQQMEIEDMDTYSISSEDNKRTSSEDQDFPEEIRKEIHGSCVEETIFRLREAPEENGSKSLKLHLHQLQEFQKNQVVIPLAMKTLSCGEEVLGNLVENNRKKTNMDTKFSDDFQTQGVEGLRFENGENCSPFKEIEVLRKKLQVLEQDNKELKEENMDLQFKLEESRRDIQACRNSASSFLLPDLNAVIKISELFSELYECCRISATNERKRMDSSALMASLDYKSNFMDGCGNEGFHVGEQVEVIFNKFIQLKNLFETSFMLHEEGCGLYEGVKSLHMEFGFDDIGLEQNTIIGSLRYENMLKDREIEGLKQCKKELEAQITRIEEEKSRTEASKTGSLGKSSVDPICKTSLKLTRNDELEVHLMELENENICLSERTSGLEAVLRYLTDEKESISLLLQDSQSNVGKLQNKVCELGNEIMTQKIDFKEKLQARKQQFFEALEEIQSLKTENKKLQAMVESIMEEHSLLKISNNEVRKKRIDLQEHCAILEVEVNDTLELSSGILNEVENLEASFCRMLKEVSSKEKSTNEELDALVREIHKHNTNVARDDSLLNQMYLEKTAEVDNLERKVMHLMKQMSTTSYDETERGVVLELSCLREDKAMLEAALQEAQGKLRLYESKIDHIHKESESKVMGVINELEVSKQNQEILMDCHRKVLSSLENVKNSELKSKNMLRRQELKLKSSESDRKNLAEEVSTLKIKLQDEVLALKKSLIESEHQNKCLKVSFEMLCEDYEKLKGKNVKYLEEISDMQKVATELGDYKRSKTALEEKVWRLEWELSAKEASCTLQSKMKNELARLRRTNSHLKGKMKYLEEDKEDCFKRIQVLEEKLKQKNEEM
ncbi:myosin heavy chain, skeletal muscle-like [Benincasa hispida]|uniref:myosin heavy chain, skeletal muscle-like n=1 Tax=Benincasa hispida TaxID=102211 RepID=UPI0019026CC7|nr:myosin heavy chain, skeletal muscle-like [Benincasa hispida]